MVKLNSHKNSLNKHGFTLAELIIGMAVTAIIVGGALGMLLAMSDAHAFGTERSYQQARVRAAMVRLPEIIKHSKLVSAVTDSHIALWVNDSDNDNLMDITEIAYIDKNTDGSGLRLIEFTSCPEWLNSWAAGLTSPFTYLVDPASKDYLMSNCVVRQAVFLTNCYNVTFLADKAAPYTESVAVSFKLAEGSTLRDYELRVTLQGIAANLISSTGTALRTDDD